MRPGEFARRVAGRHGRRPCAPPRVAMTLLRRGAHTERMLRRADTHLQHLRVTPRVAVCVHVHAPVYRAGAAERLRAPARAALAPRRPADPLRFARRLAPPGAGPRPAAPPALLRTVVAVPAADTASVAAAAVKPVPRVLRRAPAAAALPPGVGVAPSAASAARSAAALPAVRPAPPAPGRVASPPAAAVEVERITDQVVATIDRRILARRERLGRA